MTNANALHALGTGWAGMGVISTNEIAQSLVDRLNREMQDAGHRFWADASAGQSAALRLLRQFGETVVRLERCGWSADRIQSELAPSRDVFAGSPFMRRCQRWPRGHAGDFETIEYLSTGANEADPGSIGWHFEEIIMRSPVARQHRNKLEIQSREIADAILASRDARVLSVACGGCLDWLAVLPLLQDFTGEIVLNDCDAAALTLAESRLRTATGRIRLAPGNVLRVVKRLAHDSRFDLVVAGGLFDYLSDKAIVFLLQAIHEDLLAPGGRLLFTNIAEGNPWRPLMEHGSNWSLIERTEAQLRGLCAEAGIEASAVSLERESTGLTILTRINESQNPV